jgi:hypothetical protein
MAWNSTINNATDASAVAFANQYVTAINQRWRAINNQDLFAEVEAGDDFHDASLSLNGASTTNTFNWRNAQAAVDILVGNESASTWNNWIIRGTTLDNQATVSGWKLTRDYLVDEGIIPDWETIVAAPYGKILWTRKYPREHGDAAATTYTDGSAFANGHKSRQLDDLIVYERVSGAWVATTDRAPDCIASEGTVEAGDYCGPWIWTELRGVINEMEWMFCPVDGTGTPGLDTPTYGLGVGGDSTDALAKTAAEADYTTPDGSVEGNYTETIYSGSFTSAIYGWTNTATVDINQITGVDRDVMFLIWTTAPWAETYSAGTYHEFGYPVHEDAWAVFSTKTGTTAASVTSDAIGTVDGATLKSWNPTAPDGTTTVRWKGWKLGIGLVGGVGSSVICVVKWDFDQKHA